MIGNLLGQRVTLVQIGVTGRDPLGKPKTGETSRTSDIPARLEQRGSQEGDAYVVNSWVAYLPAGTEVSERDVLIEGSRRFEVEGTPALNSVPGFPAADHLAVSLKYVGEVS